MECTRPVAAAEFVGGTVGVGPVGVGPVGDEQAAGSAVGAVPVRMVPEPVVIPWAAPLALSVRANRAW